MPTARCAPMPPTAASAPSSSAPSSWGRRWNCAPSEAVNKRGSQAKPPAPPPASHLLALVGHASACQRPLAGVFSQLFSVAGSQHEFQIINYFYWAHPLFLSSSFAPSSTLKYSRHVRGCHLHVEETKLSNRLFAALLLLSTSALAQAPQADAAELRALKAAVAAAQSAGDNAWMLVSAALVLMMTGPGLALFYCGLVRKKNVLGTDQ